MITSTDNQLIKIVNSLQHKKGRLEHNLFLVEGIHLVQEAVRSGALIRYYFWSNKLITHLEGRELLTNLQSKYQGNEVNDSVLAKISETNNPQGVLATVVIPETILGKLSHLSLGIIMDGLQDPGNVGTIIRTAWAADLDGLFCTLGTADPFQGKVVRASMGGIFSQKLYPNAKPEVIIVEAKEAGIQIIAGDPTAEVDIFDNDLTIPTLFLLGNEGQGITSGWEKDTIKRVKIPQPGRAESLNVSVAAGIMVYEAIRQRLKMKNHSRV